MREHCFCLKNQQRKYVMSDVGNFLFSTPEMNETFSPEAHVKAMLAFEVALARAEADAGVIPQEAADAIAMSCHRELFDVPALYREAALAGTPAIPLVRMLTARVGDEMGKFVHWGATSQDAIDTALMIQMSEGLNLLMAALLDICASCAQFAEQHRHTLMVGRTLLQHAVPISFGLKAARWLALMVRQVEALQECRAQALVVQLGGAVGTQAALGERGIHVQELLAEELKLTVPDLPWHSERDRIARIGTTLGIVAGAVAKIATDLVLLAQTEVGEVQAEKTPGKGGSSAMPQKQNPVDAINALAASRLAIGVVPVILAAMSQEHERAVGGWQAEWAAIPDLFCYTAGAVERIRQAVSGLQVDAERMRVNLDLDGGLVMAEALTMALAPRIGRPEAQRLVRDAGADARGKGIDLRQAALNEQQIRAVLTAEEIEHALDPAHYLGSTDIFIDRALASYELVRPVRGKG
jgi:3-carboxy-cis,cis-muconate cycloisomerase